MGAKSFVPALLLPTVDLAEARFTNVLAETVMRRPRSSSVGHLRRLHPSHGVAPAPIECAALVGAKSFVPALLLPTVDVAEARFRHVLAATVGRLAAHKSGCATRTAADAVGAAPE